MSKIIWIGNPFFAHSLPALGHTLYYLSCPYGTFYDWPGLTAAAGCLEPDLVLVADQSLPPFVLGVEGFPCLTAFYAVDTHIHSWYPQYAQAFDLVLVSLTEHLPRFAGQRLRPEAILPSPPYAPDLVMPLPPEQPKEWGLLFVGTVDPAINPERHAFMRRLAELCPGLHYTRGRFTELYPKASLALNHAIAGELNFRVFEALGCGAALLTPRLAHGLDVFFRDREDLFLFNQEDIPGLARLATSLLAQPELCARVAASGLAKVNAGHRAGHRAKNLASRIEELYDNGSARSWVAGRLRQQKQIKDRYLKLIYLLHAQTTDHPVLKAAYLGAAQG